MLPRPSHVALGLLLVGCTFSPSSLTPGGGSDAAPPIDARIDAPFDELVDASPIDASPIDAAPPDATPDVCVGGSTELALSTNFTAFPAASGASAFSPACRPSSGADTFFHVDVPATTGADLVVDLVETGAGDHDAILDLNGNCATSGICEDVGDGSGSGHGEVAVLPNAAAGRHYVVVDTYKNTTPSPYSLRAFLRPVLAPLSPCDPLLVTSRCAGASYCLDPDAPAGDTPLCNALATTLLDTEQNEECLMADPISGDTAFLGISPTPNDDDWLQLTGAANFGFRAVVYTENGGCAADFRLAFERRVDCNSGLSGAAVTSNDDSLGACPTLTIPNVNITELNILRVERHKLSDSRADPTLTYTLVIDYLPPS